MAALPFAAPRPPLRMHGFMYASRIRDQHIPYYGFVKIPFTNKTVIWPTGYQEGRFEMMYEDTEDPSPKSVVTSRKLVEVLSSYQEIYESAFKVKHFVIIEGVN